MRGLRSRNPFTGEIVYGVPAAGPIEVQRAVQRVLSSANGWARTPVHQRAMVLRRFAELLDARADAFARLTRLQGRQARPRRPRRSSLDGADSTLVCGSSPASRASCRRALHGLNPSRTRDRSGGGRAPGAPRAGARRRHPAIVFADAELDAAAGAIAALASAPAEQKCTPVRRVVVERPAQIALTERLASNFEALVPGDPAKETTTLGPLITPSARRRAQRAVARAQAAGARVVARSPLQSGSGAFFAATLLDRLAPDDPLRRNELFAPVLSVEAFEQAWQTANHGASGLSAAVYTTNRDRIREATEQLRLGIISINRRSDAVDLEAPFAPTAPSGNAMPEGGEYAYRARTALRTIYNEPE